MASIRKRGENSYQITVSNGYDSKGNKLIKTKTITVDPKLTDRQREKEIQKQATLFDEDVKKGTYLDPTRLSLSEYITLWLNTQESVLAPKTYLRYKGILEGRVSKSVGHINIQKVKAVHLNDFYSNLQEVGIREDKKEGALSNRTILHHHRVLSKLFNDAYKSGLINENPCSRATAPKVSKPEMKCLNEDQISLLAIALQEESIKVQAIIMLSLMTGCRRGELGGLQWKHIDTKNNTILIEQASTYTPDTGTILKETKNKTSIRKISIPQETTFLLSQYRKWWLEHKLKVGDQWQYAERESAQKNDDTWIDPEYVFTTWDGYLMHPDTFTSTFKDFLKRHSLPDIRLHDLRHTAATMLINSGLNIKSISSRLGHANATTTLNIYSHALLSADQQAADVMGSLINKKDTSKKAQ